MLEAANKGAAAASAALAAAGTLLLAPSKEQGNDGFLNLKPQALKPESLTLNPKP